MKTDKIKSSVEQIGMSEQTKKEILDECMEYSDNPQEYESNRADYARPKRFSVALEIAACLVICGGVTGGYYALSYSTESPAADVVSESEISEASEEVDFAEAIVEGNESSFETDEWKIDFNEVFNNDFNVGYFDGEKAERYGIDESTKEEIRNVLKNSNITQKNIVSAGYDLHYPDKCYTLTFSDDEATFNIKLYEGYAYIEIDCQVGCQHNNGDVYFSPNEHHACVLSCDDIYLYDKIDKLCRLEGTSEESIISDNAIEPTTAFEETIAEPIKSESVIEPTTAVTENSERTEIYDRLNSLSYEPYTCDGLPEYELEAPDGTKYQFNFTDKWVWKNGREEAVLPNDLADSIRLEYIIYGEE